MDKENIFLQNINTEKNNNQFEEIVMIVENAKDRAYRKVNEELILMYQEVGRYISQNTKEASYGLVLLTMWLNFSPLTILN